MMILPVQVLLLLFLFGFLLSSSCLSCSSTVLCAATSTAQNFSSSSQHGNLNHSTASYSYRHIPSYSSSYSNVDGLLIDDIMFPLSINATINANANINANTNANVNTNNQTQTRSLANVPYKAKRWDTDYHDEDGCFHIPVRLSNFRKAYQEKIVLALRNLEWRSMVIKFDIFIMDDVVSDDDDDNNYDDYEKEEEEEDNTNTNISPNNNNNNNINKSYIHIINMNDGCWSWIGLMPNLASSPNGQTISLQQKLCTSFKTIQHEMMHALGFGHEQQRSDRDDYVKIHWENIQDNKEQQFMKLHDSQVNSLGTMYDFNSILHYPKNAFGRLSSSSTSTGSSFSFSSLLTTIEPIDESIVIGNRHNASRLDILQIRLMYQCRSRPRTLEEYKSTPCTTDCQCWKNHNGCGYDDDLCKGKLTCTNNKCTDNADPTIQKLFQREVNNGDRNHNRIRGKSAGVMFDFQAKDHPIKITNLFYQGITEEVWVDIYTREYTHVGWSEAKQKWKYIGEALLKQEKTPGEPRLLPFNTFISIKVKPWHHQGFYIRTKNCSGNDCYKLTVWTGKNYAETKSPFVENDTARILEGCALKTTPFSNVAKRCLDSPGGESQTFWGGFRYKVLENDMPNVIGP